MHRASQRPLFAGDLNHRLSKEEHLQAASPVSLIDGLNIATAATAFVSAGLWVIAATVRVRHDPKPDKDGFLPASISVDGEDFIETVRRQGHWNRIASYATALAAALQGAAVLLATIR